MTEGRRSQLRQRGQTKKEDAWILYGWGQSLMTFKEINSTVMTASCGENHYIFQTIRGQLFGVGSNRFGQLGLPQTTQNTTVPTEIFQDISKISQITCGPQHTIILTTKGQLYGCGLNIKGQLGLGTFENIHKPKLITSLLPHGEKNAKASNKELMRRPKPAIYGILEKFDIQVKYEQDDLSNNHLLLGPDESIEEVSCGALHTLVLSNKGRIFAAGFLNQSKSGDDYSIKADFIQVKLPNDKKVKSIASGLSTCAVISEGTVYIWGKLGKLSHSIPTAVKFPQGRSDFTIVDVQVGDAFCVFLSSKGDVYTMGQNIHSQLANSQLFCDAPVRVTRIPIIKQIYTGRNYCLAISSQDGSVWGWGANQHGQITMGNHQMLIVQSPTSLGFTIKEGDRFALGSYLTLLMRRQKLEEKKEEPSTGKSDKQEMISLKQYKKLQYDYQLLKNLNLSLIERTQKPPQQEQSSQTTSKFEVSGISKYRTFNSNLEIDWKQLKIENNISEGGYGVIYKAKWRQTTVAVKKFKIQTGDVGVRDFLSECHAMEAVRHPNIVMFLGACTKPPNYSIVMEYCQKGSLWSLLQNTTIPLPWEERKRIAIEIARAVLYLHLCNPPILHRDLKSLNILLDENLHVKIADFGWTKTLDKYMTSKIGTYQWMAPEVIGSPNYSEKADVFSYSIILWQIASREPPYKNINGQQVSQEVLNEDLRPILPKKTPEAFAKLATRCWQRDPDKRPNFKEIIKELENMKFQGV